MRTTNEQKAKDITKCLWFPQKCTEEDIQNMLMQMAEWKDEQHWKPTEKQLDALLDCANNSTRKNFLELNSLYEELVKL